MDNAALLAPLERDENLSEKVYRRLRGGLVSGQLAPGQRLVHRNLAKEFGVSPTPVREALLRLASEGGLELDGRGIAWVPCLAPDRYAEIMELRVELEGRAAAKVAAGVSAAEIAALQAMHARVSEGRRLADIRMVLTENERFHFRILSLAQMPVLQRVVENLWVQAGPTINLLFAESRPLPAPNHPHLALLRAFERRDPAAARAAMERDLREHGAVVSRVLARGGAASPAP